MIGTLYERLSAVQSALVAVGVPADRISLVGHPEAMRPFATSFDTKLSEREIEFLDPHTMKWRGGYVWQRTDLDERDRIFVRVSRVEVIVVEHFKPPRLFEGLPQQATFYEIGKRALERINGRAAT